MEVNTINAELILDAKLTNLLPGVFGKTAHQAKSDKILNLAYMTQIVSIPVIQVALGSHGRPCTNSNANACIKSMIRKNLIKELQHDPNEFNMTGRIFMLTDAGLIRAQCVTKVQELHDYNLHPESVRRSQLPHDLAVAQIAANFMAHGAKILETDMTQRAKYRHSQNRQIKLPDLIAEIDGQTIAIEVERSPKIRREVEQSLLLAARSQRLRAVWLINAPVTQSHFAAAIETGLIGKWKLSHEHKWTESGKTYLPHEFRRKQMIAPLNQETLNRKPIDWLRHIDKAEVDFDNRIAQELRKQGWEWTALQEDQSHHGEAIFELRHVPTGESFIVSTQDDGVWVICKPEQTLVEGKRLRITTTPWNGEVGTPSLALVDAAIAETDIDIPLRLRDR